MPRVSWGKAQADLESIDPAMVGQLRDSAEEILHDIPPVEYPADEGVALDRIMWHRGAAHESLNEQADGPQNYLLLYKKQDSDPEFEILAVRSIQQIANKHVKMRMEWSYLTLPINPVRDSTAGLILDLPRRSWWPRTGPTHARARRIAGHSKSRAREVTASVRAFGAC